MKKRFSYVMTDLRDDSEKYLNVIFDDSIDPLIFLANFVSLLEDTEFEYFYLKEMIYNYKYVLNNNTFFDKFLSDENVCGLIPLYDGCQENFSVEKCLNGNANWIKIPNELIPLKCVSVNDKLYLTQHGKPQHRPLDDKVIHHFGKIHFKTDHDLFDKCIYEYIERVKNINDSEIHDFYGFKYQANLLVADKEIYFNIVKEFLS
jgi:hypothetical protein